MEEYEVVLTKQAEANLDEIVAFIRASWPEAVKTEFLATVADKLQLLATMPFMYRSSLAEPGVRQGVINRYVSMYYRIIEESKRVEILAFRDNRQG